MSGLVLPPGSNGGINIFKPPWEQPTPEGMTMLMATLPKELVDHIVSRTGRHNNPHLDDGQLEITIRIATKTRATELATLVESQDELEERLKHAAKTALAGYFA